MKNTCVFGVAIVLLCLFSCKSEKQEKMGKIDIDFFSELEDFNSLDICSENTLIALSEDTSAEYLLKQIDKVIVKNSIIYIADTYMKNLFLYDMEGRRIGKVGKKGDGPGEYLSLSDFCIGDDGKIYWYDGIKNRVQVYEKDLSLLKEYEVPFKAECIQSVVDGFLFSLAPYNTDSLTEKSCLVYTDAQFKPLKTFLQHSDNIDLNVEFYSPLVSLGDRVLYNRVIDNNIYIVDDKGVKKCYHFDFGAENVEDESLRDLNKFMESGKDYCYIALPPILFQDLFIGCVNRSGDIYTFAYDMKTNKSYMKKLSEFSLNSVNLPMSLSDDNRLISYINKDIYPEFETDRALSDEVRHTMENEGFVICLSKLK